MKARTFVSLLLILSALAFRARSSGIYTYEVDWPSNHLAGTFTLGFGSAFGQYSSTEAEGTYGNPGVSQTTLASVEFWSQPNYAELVFNGENRSDLAFDVYPPVSKGQYVSWTDANEAWQALLTQSAADGVSISIVPEPTKLALLGAGLLALMLFRQARGRGRMSPDHSLASNAFWPCPFRCRGSRHESAWFSLGR